MQNHCVKFHLIIFNFVIILVLDYFNFYEIKFRKIWFKRWQFKILIKSKNFRFKKWFNRRFYSNVMKISREQRQIRFLSSRNSLQKKTRYYNKISFVECENRDNFSYFRKRKYVFNFNRLRFRIIQLTHDNVANEHFKKFKCYDLVTRVYWWLNMYKYVQRFVLTIVRRGFGPETTADKPYRSQRSRRAGAHGVQNHLVLGVGNHEVILRIWEFWGVRLEERTKPTGIELWNSNIHQMIQKL